MEREMLRPVGGKLGIIGAVAAASFLVLVSLASIGGLAGNNAMGHAMSNMLSSMGGMMDGDMHGGMMGAGAGPETTGSAAGEGSVRIADFRFDPTVLTVSRGTVVTWTNYDDAPHTATEDSKAWDTGMLNKGDSASITFDNTGEYAYYCAVHPAMKARIIVR
jgi:plastocyanin